MQNSRNHNHKVGSYFHKASTVFDTFYDEQRSPFMRWIDKEFRSDVFERFYRTFDTLVPMEGKKVLDIGCGSGPYVVECAERGAYQVLGFDMAEGMLALGRKRADAKGVADKCKFTRGSFPDNAPEGTFDYAIVMGVMDYVPDPLAFLSALRKKVDVKAVLSFPSKHWFRTPLRKIRYMLKNCPVYFYEVEQLKRLGQQAGFSEVKIDKMPGAGMDYFVTLIK